jgi:hypothetical protein
MVRKSTKRPSVKFKSGELSIYLLVGVIGLYLITAFFIPIPKTNDIGGQAFKVAVADRQGDPTGCNNFVSQSESPFQYNGWTGTCTNDMKQAPASGGAGQGCCEFSCGASRFCDEKGGEDDINCAFDCTYNG